MIWLISVINTVYILSWWLWFGCIRLTTKVTCFSDLVTSWSIKKYWSNLRPYIYWNNYMISFFFSLLLLISCSHWFCLFVFYQYSILLDLGFLYDFVICWEKKIIYNSNLKHILGKWNNIVSKVQLNCIYIVFI